MSSARAPLFVTLLILLTALGLLVGCSGDSSALAKKGGQAGESATPESRASLTPAVSPSTASAQVSPTSVPTQPPATATAAPQPSATPQPPAPPAAQPAGSVVEFKPTQLVQGGVAIVYLNEPATSATARFGEKQYPMLHDGTRWWAIIGIGAFTQPGLAPVSVTYTPVGKTTTTSAAQSIMIVKRDFPFERIDLDATTSALLAQDIINAELNQRASIYSGFTTQRLWSGPFLNPSKAPIGDVYGIARSYNGAPATDYHRGTDFTAQTGDAVTAAGAGRVVFAGSLKVRGGSVILDHGAGVFTAYRHLSAIDVSQGQMVAAGDRLGATGSTGLVTGPHLHWEVIVRGVEVDGQLWLRGTEIGP